MVARTKTWSNAPGVGSRSGTQSPNWLLASTGSASIPNSRSIANNNNVLALQSP